MPSATPELQTEWGTDETAIRYLKNMGCSLLYPTYYWVVPDNPGISATMYRALTYLTLEWDFGGSWYFQSEYDDLLKKGLIDRGGRRIKKEEPDHDT